jgi:hypothetical protein
MLRKLIAIILAAAVPATASAGPLKDAAEKAGRELAATAQAEEKPRGTRFWTGIALVGGGAVLGTIGGIQLGKEEEDEGLLDDGEDADDSDDGEDSDWTGKAMVGGGIAAATIGGVLLLTGRKGSGPVVSVRPGGVAVRQTIRF